MINKKIVAGGAAVALVLSIAACSSGSKSSPKATTTGLSSSSSSQPTGAEITIGFLLGETGSSSSGQKYSAAVAQAWVKHVNTDLGGINGHPVRIIIKDTTGQPVQALSAATELVESDHVDALMIVDSATEASLGAYTAKQNVPVLGFGYSDPTWEQPNWFPSMTFSQGVIGGILVSAHSVGSPNFMDMVCAEQATCAAEAPLEQAAAQKTGVTDLGQIQAAATQPDYTAQCLQAIDKKAQYLQLSVFPTVAVKVTSDCIAKGDNDWFGASGGSMVASAWTNPALKMAGVLDGFPWYSDAAPVQEFRSVMAKYAPGAPYQDPTSTGTWTALELFRAAQAHIGVPSREAVFQGYWSVKNEVLGGLLPSPITFTQGKPAAPILCFWLYKLENGKFSPATAAGTSGNGVDNDLATSCVSP